MPKTNQNPPRVGRPTFEPTENDRNVVKNLSAAGLSHNRIKACIFASNGRPIDDKTLRKYFRTELDTTQDMVTAMATSKVVSAIKNEKAWAICFWLKCRAGFRETQAHQFVDQDGKDRPFLLSDADRLIADADAADAK